MKNIKIKSVNIPWYIEPFAVYSYSTGELTIGIWSAIKFWTKVVWFYFPNKLQEYQMSRCKDYIPDYIDIKKAREATGNKVTPFLGYVIRTERGVVTRWDWWNLIEKY